MYETRLKTEIMRRGPIEKCVQRRKVENQCLRSAKITKHEACSYLVDVRDTQVQ
jgi:hypothetical protein